MDLPIVLYNVPSRTGVNIQPKTVAELYKIPNIVALKQASGNLSETAQIASLCDITLYSGNDDQIVPILSLGGKGVISVLSNICPQETHEIVARFMNGDITGSRELQLKALPLIEKLFCEVNPIPVKKAMQLMGIDCGPLRMPLTEMTEANAALLAQAMKEFGIKLA